MENAAGMEPSLDNPHGAAFNSGPSSFVFFDNTIIYIYIQSILEHVLIELSCSIREL